MKRIVVSWTPDTFMLQEDCGLIIKCIGMLLHQSDCLKVNLQYHRLPAWGFLSIMVYVISNQYCAISTYNYWSTCQLATVKAPSPNFLVHVTFCQETRLGPRRPCFTVSISGGIKLVEGGEGRREGGEILLRVNLVSFPDPQYGMQWMYGTESLGTRLELTKSKGIVWEFRNWKDFIYWFFIYLLGLFIDIYIRK